MATLMDYCAPVIVLLLSPLLLRQKQGARAYIGHGGGDFRACARAWHRRGAYHGHGARRGARRGGVLRWAHHTQPDDKGLQRPAAHGRRACNSGGGHAVLCPAQGREHPTPRQRGGHGCAARPLHGEHGAGLLPLFFLDEQAEGAHSGAPGVHRPGVGPRIRGCFPEREHDRAADFSGLPSCWLARLTGSRAGKSGFDKPPGAVYNRQ